MTHRKTDCSGKTWKDSEGQWKLERSGKGVRKKWNSIWLFKYQQDSEMENLRDGQFQW